MSDEKTVTLFYAGKEFKLPGNQAELLDSFGSETGTARLNMGDGKWLTIVVGPGIPAAIIES